MYPESRLEFAGDPISNEACPCVCKGDVFGLFIFKEFAKGVFTVREL